MQQGESCTQIFRIATVRYSRHGVEERLVGGWVWYKQGGVGDGRVAILLVSKVRPCGKGRETPVQIQRRAELAMGLPTAFQNPWVGRGGV